MPRPIIKRMHARIKRNTPPAPIRETKAPLAIRAATDDSRTVENFFDPQTTIPYHGRLTGQERCPGDYVHETESIVLPPCQEWETKMSAKLSVEKQSNRARQNHRWLGLLCATSVCLSAAAVPAGITFQEPAGGWKYTYDGDIVMTDPIESLDGTWDHDNGSDAWDESAIGEGAPGGVTALVDGATTFIRIQDTGDPRDYEAETGVTGDPSNRKIFFDRDIIDLDDISETFLDDGFTFSFRARLATAATGPIDPHYPDGGDGAGPWPDEGFGYVIDFDSTTNFSFYQPDNTGSIGFALATPRPDFGIDETGLLMNNANGDIPCANCGDTDQGDLNLMPVENLTDWHEFWITVKAIEGGDGTHEVNVYLDGSTEPQKFEVTAGTRADGGFPLTQGPMSIGMPGTVYEGAIDLDFISYIAGVVPPTAAGPTGDFDGDGQLDVDDINQLTETVRAGTNDPKFDVNGDGAVNQDDRTVWVESIKKTYFGDANLDGVFNTEDFLQVFQIGEFEDNVPANSTWEEGDWDGNADFETGDFIKAFQGGGFEKGPRAAVSAVPEPSSALLALLGLLPVVLRRRK